MALSKCDYCGKPFNSMGSKVCSDCMQRLDEAFIIIRKYIYQNSVKTDFTAIIENTGVSEKILSYLMNQGRVNIDNTSGKGGKCRVCGSETQSGVLCEQCKQKLFSEQFMSAATKSQKTATESGKSSIIPLSFSEKD